MAARSEELRAQLARARRRARTRTKDDWATLFRHMADAARRLADHPFLKGDAEAELRLKRTLAATDFEEMDRRLDHLADYLEGKMAAVAIRQGRTPPPPRARRNGPDGRAMGSMGPSGDDFGPEAAPRRREMIRL